MPRYCQTCKYYTPSSNEVICPECRLPLHFTMLPHVNLDVGSGSPTATAVASGRQSQAVSAMLVLDDAMAWCLAHRTIVLAGLIVITLAMGLLGYGTVNGVPLRERYDQIQEGMEDDDVLDILETNAALIPLWRRFIEVADENDETHCTWIWQEGGAKITIELRDGKVASKSQEGLGPQ